MNSILSMIERTIIRGAIYKGMRRLPFGGYIGAAAVAATLYMLTHH